MKLTHNDLINLASAVLLQMRSPHLPEDCEHFKELDKLYTKLIRGIDNAKSNRQTEG